MRHVRNRLTYANVMSTIAVVLALGGASAFAASHLARNSVGTKQLKRGAVTAAKLQANAVSGDKVLDGSLSGADVNEASLGAVPLAGRAQSAELAERAGQASTLTPLPSGASESGIFDADRITSADLLVATLNFPQRLSTPVQPSAVEVARFPSPACPGPGHAAAGKLCIYPLSETLVRPHGPVFLESPFGIIFSWEFQGPGTPAERQALGTWTLTAP